MLIDVLVVGGGPAGLSASLVLGRCHRRVLICDEGKPRNRASRAIHALLGSEGIAPAAFLEQGRRDLDRYATVSIKAARVISIERAMTASSSNATMAQAELRLRCYWLQA